MPSRNRTRRRAVSFSTRPTHARTQTRRYSVHLSKKVSIGDVRIEQRRLWISMLAWVVCIFPRVLQSYD